MDSVAFDRVSVWLDPMTARSGAFLQALDWASSLNVPLRILAPSSKRTDPLLDGAPSVPAEECAAACARRGVPFEVVERLQLSDSMQHLFCPHGLSVFSGTLPANVREVFLCRSLRTKHAAILICPELNAPVSRVLILHARQDPTSGFLDSALSTCRVFRASPVILTVARTERQARHGQLLAEQACYVQRQAAHLDYVAGVDVRAAVASIARWRRCSHVFLERRQAIPWWRWLRGDTLARLLRLTDSLTFLALPEGQLHAALKPPAQDVLPSR